MTQEGGLYVHIPFCDHKCIYCDFYSIIKDDNKSTYLDCLLKEINHYSSIYSTTHRFTTIYFGGGTPSIVEPEYLGKIILHLKEKFTISENAEITMETNPGTVSLEKLKQFNEVGINRISIGIQSFDKDDLKFLTRIHDSETAIKTVNDAFTAGFKDISIDLIFNLPGQTQQKWRKNLEIATYLPITHISAYSLILEKGTILNKMVINGDVTMQDVEIDSELYEITMKFLEEKGFTHYEVSNYCKPGFECKHNQIYWDNKNYLSFGTSAHSYMNETRWWNFSALSIYNSAMKQKNEAVAGSEKLTKRDLYEEKIMLGLRSRGIEIDTLPGAEGEEWYLERKTIIDQLIDSGKMIIEGKTLKLTNSGFHVCDEIVERLL